LFNAGNIAWYRLKNERRGENYFRELIARFPGDPLSESALATLGEEPPPGAGPKKNTADSGVKAFPFFKLKRRCAEGTGRADLPYLTYLTASSNEKKTFL
jgi:hypothetical protein